MEARRDWFWEKMVLGGVLAEPGGAFGDREDVEAVEDGVIADGEEMGEGDGRKRMPQRLTRLGYLALSVQALTKTVLLPLSTL